MVLPGDDLVSASTPRTMRAVSIDASIEAVWPWLVQIGEDRGGFYSDDWLERVVGAHIHNTQIVHPEWQELSVGDSVWLARRYDQRARQVVADIEPKSHLVLMSEPDFDRMARGEKASGARGFYLRPDDGPSRLLARGSGGAVGHVTFNVHASCTVSADPCRRFFRLAARPASWLPTWLLARGAGAPGEDCPADAGKLQGQRTKHSPAVSLRATGADVDRRRADRLPQRTALGSDHGGLRGGQWQPSAGRPRRLFSACRRCLSRSRCAAGTRHLWCRVAPHHLRRVHAQTERARAAGMRRPGAEHRVGPSRRGARTHRSRASRKARNGQGLLGR